MHWVRDWFCKGRTLSARHRRTNTARPALERLEDRRTPSVFAAVSSVSDNAGHSETFDVHNDGTLWYQVNGSAFVPVQDVSNGQLQSERNVKSVSAGMNSSGLADAFVVHNDGSLTELQAVQSDGTVKLQSTSLAGGVSKVVAEGNGTALIIDNQNFLWQFDLNPNDQWPMPVDSNGNPQFPGQPSTPLAANMSLLDANVLQATLLKDALVGNDKVIALHTDGTLTSDLAPTQNPDATLMITPIAGSIQSISSVIARGNPYANYLYTVTSTGHVQKDELFGTALMTVQDLGNANGAGFKDVNVGWNSGDWVATTTSGQVFRDGQLMVSGAASAFAGPGGSFYEVTQNGTLEQWSPQAHEIWVWIYQPPILNRPGHWVKVPFWTNWTAVDSNVSDN
jgi:hypothetical protein